MTGRFYTSPMLNDAWLKTMEHIWRHKVGHSERFSLFRQGPFQRTPKWPKVTGTRGSWDLAISLKMISKTRRLLSFAFYKVKMSVLERRLSGQKALPRLMTALWALGLTWEREQREPTPACCSVTSTHAHTRSVFFSQDFLWSRRLLLVPGQSLPNSCMQRLTFPSDRALCHILHMSSFCKHRVVKEEVDTRLFYSK